MKRVLLLNLPSEVPCYRILHRAKVGDPNYIWPLVDFVCLSGILHGAGFGLEHKDFQVDRGGSLENFLRERRCDAVVAAYNPFDEAHDLRQLARVRELYPDTDIYLLASHKDRLESGHVEAVLRANPFIKALVYDYAYNSLPELMNDPASDNLRNIFLIRNGRLAGRAEDLPQEFTLPVPRHELFKDPAYFHYDSAGGLLTASMGSFGCKMQCPFCWGPQLYSKVVTRTPEDLADEMAHIAACGIEEVYFHDFSFGYHRDKLLKFCGLVRERGIKLRWFCSSRFDLMTPETIAAMAAAGCRCVEFGLESGNFEVRKLYGKSFPDEQVAAVMRACKEHGVHTSVFLILGLPEENLEDMRRSIKFASDAGFDYLSLNILWVEPLTKLSDKIPVTDASVSPLESMKKLNFSHPSVSAAEVLALQKSAMRSFYFSSSFILGQLRALRSWKRLRLAARIAWKLLSGRAAERQG